MMCWSRNKYHYAVRRAKRAAGSLKSKMLIEADEKGDAALVREMKRTLGSKKNEGQVVPNCLDGKVTHETILEQFRECYEELYNSAGTVDAMNTIKYKLMPVVQ